MTLAEWYDRQIPEYYDTMYMDGYSPEQILYAARRKLYDDYQDRMEEQEENEPVNVKIKSEVKIK